jgi:SOS-response transcriptional repressor LexA
MTPRQRETLDFVCAFWEKHRSSPSYDEIREGIGLKSKSGVFHLLSELERQGFVVRDFNKTRSVIPVGYLPTETQREATKTKIAKDAKRRKTKKPQTTEPAEMPWG